MSLGKRIAQIRARTGLSQTDFAPRMDVSTSALKNYERGASDPPARLLVELCTTYDVRADWLLLGSGTETPDRLYEEVERVVVKVRQWAADFPVSVPAEKEAQIVAMLLKYRLTTDNPSEDTENFLMEKAA
jgi:transcriptional regulator with XRE-family HTH domain